MVAASGDLGRHDPYAALRIPDYRYFLSGHLLANIGMRMQGAALLWEVYARTSETYSKAGAAMALAWVGLLQVLPVIGLALPAGHAADHFSRRRLVMVAQLVIATGSAGLAINSTWFGSVHAIYALLLLTGLARAFQQPARAALMPQIVPRERFSNAVTWSTGAFQLAAVLGPALGGAIIALVGSPALVYFLDMSGALAFFAALVMVREPGKAAAASAATLRTLLAGVEFVWRHKLILGAITLDLFAVLLGGAVTLLPIYAEDILHVGARGLGWMLAAPFLGALVMSFALAHRRPMERAGSTLLWAVVAFGVATIVFAVSRVFWLSVLMLLLTGAADAISVVVRHTLVQLLTPDEMRGRVSAINGLFIGISNEMGGFESGLVAALFGGGAYGATVSAVSGGLGTLAVVAIVALLWPELRRYGRLGSVPTAMAPALGINAVPVTLADNPLRLAQETAPAAEEAITDAEPDG